MPTSDCQVRDPRIRRTRKLLQGALGTLLQTKRFDEISVQDIAEAATVNRATFYDHYTDKFALLEAMVAGGFHEFLDHQKVRYDAGCPSALAAIILATCEFLTQVHAGGACDRQTAFQPLMDAAMVKSIRRLLTEGLQRANPLPEMPADLIAAAASATIFGAVKEWLAMPEHPTAEAVLPQILALALAVLDAGFRVASPVPVEALAHGQ
jgi:AcrR family transcriptional regulator